MSMTSYDSIILISITPPTLLASSGWWHSVLPYTIYHVPSTIYPIPFTFYYLRLSTFDLRPFALRPTTSEQTSKCISREVWRIVLPPSRSANICSILAHHSQTLIIYICRVWCKQLACLEPAKKNGQRESSMFSGPLCHTHHTYHTYLPYGIGRIIRAN